MATTIDGPVRAHAPAQARTRTAVPFRFGWLKQISYGCALSLRIQFVTACLCLAVYATGRLSTWPTIALVIITGSSLSPAWILLNMPYTTKAFLDFILRCIGIAIVFGLELYLCVLWELAHYW